jgi:succinyl-CoA synthetase alpha subunit
MSILVDKNTRLVTTGITGSEGTFHTLRNRDYGTNVVAGVTPGKGGQDVDGIPVFNTIHEAVDKQGANTAMIFVPPRFAADSILEAEDAGIELIIAITEGIPAHDEERPLASGRAELSRHPVPGQGQRRDHPGDVLQGGQRRRRLTLRDAHLPGW